MEISAATLSRSKPLSLTETADHIDARAQFGVALAQLEAAVQIVVANDVVLQGSIELEVRQRLEDDSAVIDGMKARGANIVLQRLHAVGATVSVPRLAL